MTDYTKLVAALRYCAEQGDFHCGKDCPMYDSYPTCLTKMDTDAADAIEALDAKADYWMGQAQEEYEKRLRQLPKRGKWVGVSPTVDTVECYVCGGQLFSAELETPYCPYCGAKMEVQE